MIGAALVAAAAGLSAGAARAGEAVVSYVASTAEFPNPERGLYRHSETNASAPVALDLTTLVDWRTTEGITLVFRLYYLDTFVTSPISGAFLSLIENDMALVRSAGLKTILRFAYARPVGGLPNPPHGDADRTQVLTHLDQLEPFFRANADVIAVVQAGFIGLWGEWFYTDHFGDAGIVSAEDWADRLAVLARLQDALPLVRMAQVRTPQYKQSLFATTSPIGPAEAWQGARRARTGFHNDCFLASDDDFGTYVDADDRLFLADETLFLPMGGETCNDNPPRSLCPDALAELAAYHWTYLNTDYHPAVLQSWDTGGCLPEVTRRLGYRLELRQGTYDLAVRPGEQFEVAIDLENTGFAAMFNPRPVELLLRRTGTGELYGVRLPDDPRLWQPDGTTHAVRHTVCVPGDLDEGSYELLLRMPDLFPQLAGRAEYSVLFANDGGVRETATGFNDLRHGISVSSSAASSPCGSALVLVPIAGLGGLPPGRVPADPAVGPLLTMERGAQPGELDLAWGASCSPGALDYAVMEGAIGSWANPTPITCTSAGATAVTVAGSAGNLYYLVVPLSPSAEGSYGVDSAGSERPPSPAACLPSQNLASCP